VVRFLDAPHWGPRHAHLPVAGTAAGAEVWHVLAAHEGSGAVLGCAGPAPDPGTLLDRPLDELAPRRAIRAGATILIPPGLVHALGGGALAYGLLVPGTRTVVLDPEAADEGDPLTAADLAALDLTATALDGRSTDPAPTLPNGRGLAHWPNGVRLERAGLLAPHAERYDGRAGAIYTPIAGELELTGADGSARLARGESALVPACAGEMTLRAAGKLGACTLLKVTLGS